MLRRTAAAAAACTARKQGGGAQSPATIASGARRFAEQAVNDGAEAAKEAGGWLKDVAANKLRLFAAAGLGIILLNVGANAGFDWYYHKQVLDTLMRGVLPPPQPPPVLPRADLRSGLRDVLQPKEPSSFYHVVTGPPGGGKSTLLRAACLELGRGVGYVDVNPAFEVDFGKDLGHAFNFRFQEHMNRMNIVSQPLLGTQYEDPNSKHPLASVRQSAEALHDAAAEFRHRTGKPFVLVIDSSDRLASSEEGERVLGVLRAYARDWAQEGVLTTVFVAHDWSTVEKLTGDHPAQSRAAPVFRVPDITQQEAVQYLTHLGVDDKAAPQCADLVGGSLLLLQRLATMLRAGVPFADAKQQLFDLVEMAYVAAGLLDQTPQQDGGLAVIEALLKSKHGAISAAEWREQVPVRAHQRSLLARGVLRFDGRHVQFSSNLAAAYARERLGSRLPQSTLAQHKQLR